MEYLDEEEGQDLDSAITVLVTTLADLVATATMYEYSQDNIDTVVAMLRDVYKSACTQIRVATLH